MRKRAEALENLATVHPHAAGLDLDAKTPAEIALAILTEILAVRRKGSGQMAAMMEGGSVSTPTVFSSAWGCWHCSGKVQITAAQRSPSAAREAQRVGSMPY